MSDTLQPLTPELSHVESCITTYGDGPDSQVYTTYIGPGGSVRYKTSEMEHLKSLHETPQLSQYIPNFLAKFELVVPSDISDPPEVFSAKSVESYRQETSAEQDVSPLYVGDGRWNLDALLLGMSVNDKIKRIPTQDIGEKVEQYHTRLRQISSGFLVFGTFNFFNPGFAITPDRTAGIALPLPGQSSDNELQLEVAPIIHRKVEHTIHLDPKLDRHLYESLLNQTDEIVGWLGLDSFGYMHVLGRDNYLTENVDVLPGIIAKTVTAPEVTTHHHLLAHLPQAQRDFLSINVTPRYFIEGLVTEDSETDENYDEQPPIADEITAAEPPITREPATDYTPPPFKIRRREPDNVKDADVTTPRTPTKSSGVTEFLKRW